MSRKTFYSTEDSSINTIYSGLEARFVQRDPSYFIIYVSSHNGCNQTCRMCHLTSLGQTSFEQSSIHEYRQQWLSVMSKMENIPLDHTQTVHLNFMARGEPLLNTNVTSNYDLIVSQFKEDVQAFLKKKVNVNVLISTIFPSSVSEEQYINTMNTFAQSSNPPRLYYSLYSVDKDIRKKWLPRSLPVSSALDILSYYEDICCVENKIHFCFIENVNDSLHDVEKMVDMLESYSLAHLDWNIVRYNPYSEKYGTEASECIIRERVEYVQNRCHNNVTVVPIVGFDVKASCGMFLKDTVYGE